MNISNLKQLLKAGAIVFSVVLAIALILGAGEPTEPVPAAEARQFAVLYLSPIVGSYAAPPNYPPGGMKTLHFEFAVTASDNSDLIDDPWGVKPKFQELTITKEFDTASPDLNYHCAAGTHFATATLMIMSATGPSDPPYYIITLQDAVVTKVKSRMAYRTTTPTGYAHLEEVSLKCGLIRWEITGASPKEWDIVHNGQAE